MPGDGHIAVRVAGLELLLQPGHLLLLAELVGPPGCCGGQAAFEELTERWGRKYRAIVRPWENAWEEFIPFLP